MWALAQLLPAPAFLFTRVLDRGAQAAVRGGARCASQVLDRGAKTDAYGAAQVLGRGAQADAHGGAQELDRGAQAVARGAARCAPQVLDRCARSFPAAPLVVRCRYLIVASRPLPAADAAALAVDRRAVFIYRGAQAVARDGARCPSKVLDRCARPLPALRR